MAAITIDRLSLKLSGLTGHDGERLARLIAEGLAEAGVHHEGSTRRLDELNVNIQSSAGSDVDRLSRQIVTEVLRQLSRTI